MLSSVILHAAVQKNSFNHKANGPPGQSLFTTLAIFAETVEMCSKEGFILLITAHKWTLLITTCFYLQKLLIHGIDLIFSLLISSAKDVRLLKSEVKCYKCLETGQNGQVPLVPPDKPLAKLLKINVLKILFLFCSKLKFETSANTNEIVQQYLVDQEIKT